MGFVIANEVNSDGDWHLNYYAAGELLSLLMERHPEDDALAYWIDRARACQFLYFSDVCEESPVAFWRVIDAFYDLASDIAEGRLRLADVPVNEESLVRAKYRELQAILEQTRVKYGNVSDRSAD